MRPRSCGATPRAPGAPPVEALTAYAADVRAGLLPADDETYHLSAEVAETLSLYGGAGPPPPSRGRPAQRCGDGRMPPHAWPRRGDPVPRPRAVAGRCRAAVDRRAATTTTPGPRPCRRPTWTHLSGDRPGGHGAAGIGTPPRPATDRRALDEASTSATSSSGSGHRHHRSGRRGGGVRACSRRPPRAAPAGPDGGHRPRRLRRDAVRLGPDDSVSGFYMRNTPTPLSIGWFDADGAAGVDG